VTGVQTCALPILADFFRVAYPPVNCCTDFVNLWQEKPQKADRKHKARGIVWAWIGDQRQL